MEGGSPTSTLDPSRKELNIVELNGLPLKYLEKTYSSVEGHILCIQKFPYSIPSDRGGKDASLKPWKVSASNTDLV